MKIKLLAVVALMMAFAAPTFAVDIDITDDPNKSFLLGYKHAYRGNCEVIWFAAQWGSEYLMSIGDCKSISNERAYDDAMLAIKYVKQNSKFKNFSEYFRDVEAKQEKTTSPSPLRCVDTSSGTYIFLPAEAQNKPGWFYLEKLRNGGRLSSNIVGFWREVQGGKLIADFGINTINVNMQNVYAC